MHLCVCVGLSAEALVGGGGGVGNRETCLLVVSRHSIGGGKRLGAQNQTRTLLGEGGRGPGAAHDGKQGKDEGQVHGFGWQNALWDGVRVRSELWHDVICPQHGATRTLRGPELAIKMLKI